ncbi:CD44 antigen isoform X1 [Corvus hawaiiensis]|uniref:CD44 antigen isoform X1 n=1 Tax=Corvus hawaiiensis TaxID=134902 RepID=UPI002019A7C7|nr:CD44 antigen isoform X1 [Corvus hawaiiensis]
MANFSLWATFGLCLLKLCLTETEFNVSCRYRGVFHVEKNGRYSLTRSEAVKLCRALNSTLATLEQLKEAHESGFETCRYGFVVGHIVIPRIKPYPLCAANTTGIYKLPANTTDRYDAYCYNASETEEKACEPIKTIDTSLLSNQDETVIDNADGSRYNPDGSRHTSGESSTSGVDEENAGSGSTHETTPMDTSIRRSSPSYYGSPTPVSQLPDHTFGGGEKGIPEKDYGDEFTSISPHISLGTVAGDFHEEDDRQYPASTTPGPHHDNLEKTTTQTWWNPFPDHWWWSNPGEKTQEPTPATKADVTSSGSDSDDEDSSEEMMNPTVFPVRSVAKDETALSTTPGPHHDNLEKTTTQTWWNPFPDHWWWSNPGEKTQEPTPATKADVTSSGSDSDDEDSSEEMMNPTVFPVRSVAKDETALSTTPGPHHDNLEKTTTQTWWNPFPDHWWWSNPGEKTQEPTPATKADVTSSGSDSDDEDSSEQMTYSTVFPGWGRSVAKDETALSTTVDSQHETLLEITTQDRWNPTFADEEEQYPSSASRVIILSALVTSENEKRHGATQHPLFHSVHSGGISQEQNPANTTGSIEQHEFTTAGGSYFGKETSTAMVPSHGAKQNDSEQDPLVYPGWDKGKDYATQPAITDRVIPSTENNHERESSTTAVASPDGAYHKDPTQPLLPSDNASEKSTEGITNPTDAPWDEVLHRTTASMTETVTASTDVLAPEDITQEAWAPHLVVTVASSPDGAHHKEPTQTPLPSDDEPGQGTEGTTNPTDTPRDEVLHRTTASMTKTGNDSPLMGTIVESVDGVDQEKATKEPLAPGTTPGREGEEANTTGGSHVHGIPGVFSDIEDRFIPLQTPLTTSSTSSVYVSQGPHKGHYESTTSLEETATTQIASQPRSAHVPDWLIIVVALVVLALILAVCIAVNSRRRCGQKKKLVINNGKGAVEDRKTSELNGDVSKSQEMVHLVHKEQSNDRTQACDEFLTVNETQNHHEFDMKTGV